jgi:hypothetical protein
MLHLNLGLGISSAFSLPADDKNRGSTYKPLAIVGTLTLGLQIMQILGLKNVWHVMEI